MQLNFENSQFFTTIPTSAGMPFDLDIALLSAADRSRIWLELEKILRFDMLSRIPSEVALRIFTLLDARSLCRASQVSRNWHRLADDDLLWHRLCQQHIEKKCGKCGWMLPLMRCVGGDGRTTRSYSTDSTTSEDHIRRNLNQMQIVGGSEPQQQQQMELDRCAINPCMPDELRKIQLKQHFSIPTAPTQSPPLKKGWKNIYAERYLVENNWRKSRYTSRVLSGHTQTVLCVHAIANRLITGSADWTARVWDIPSGECVLILRGHRGPVRALQFDDTKIITGGDDGTIKVWNTKTGECIRTTDAGHGSAITSLTYNDWTLAGGTADGQIFLWNCRLKQGNRFRAHLDSVTSLAFDRSPSSATTTTAASDQQQQQQQQQSDTEKSYLFTAAMDGLVKMWDWKTGTCIRVFSGHIGPVLDVKVFNYPSYSLSVLLSASQDGTIRLWDYLSATETSAPLAPPSTNGSVGSSSSSNNSGEIDRWFGHVRGVTAINYNSNRLCSGGREGFLLLHSIQEGRLLYRIPLDSLHHQQIPPSASITCIATDDIRIFAGVSSTGDVVMIDFGS